MAEVVRDRNTGQAYVKDGDRLRPISDDQIPLAQESGIEAFFGAAGDSIGGAVAGAASLLGAPGAREAYDQTQANQETRGAVHPWAATAGAVLPDVAAAAASGGSTIMGTLARGAVMDAGLGAARNPDAPIAGAAIGAGVGLVAGGAIMGAGRILGRGAGLVGSEARARPAPMADRVLARLDPEVTGGPGSIMGTSTADMARAGKQGFTARMSGFFTGEGLDDATRAEAARLGIKLTPADMRGSAAMKNMEGSMQANPTGQAVFEREIQRPNQEVLNRLAGRAAGFEEDTAKGITPDMMGQNADRIRAGFEDAAAKIGKVEIATEEIADAVKRDVVVPDVSAQVDTMLANVPREVDGPAGLDYVSRVRESAAGQWRQGNSELARAMDTIADEVEARMIAAAPQEVAGALKKLRMEWKAQRLIERSGTLTEEGDVAFGSLRQGMRGDKHFDKAYRRGRSMGSEGLDDLAAATRLLARFRDRVGNSGTATRSADFLDPRTYLAYPLAQGYLRAGAVPGQ